MLPSLRPFLRYIDADSKVAAHGFTPKVRGSSIRRPVFLTRTAVAGCRFSIQSVQTRRMYGPKRSLAYSRRTDVCLLDTDFVNLDADSGAWNVIRSEFDEILLNHAADSGAAVFQERKVTRIGFDAKDSTRPVSADYEGPFGQKGTIHFDYLVDASGRKGIMSTKYLKNRKMNSSLKNIATWGYWTGGKAYAAGTYRNNAPFFEALTDESGWAWYIPLHDATFSVGFVLDSESNTRKKAGKGIKEHYLAQLEFLPRFRDLLSDAKLHDSKLGLQSATDYSYSATSYAGPFYRLIGDASGTSSIGV